MLRRSRPRSRWRRHRRNRRTAGLLLLLAGLLAAWIDLSGSTAKVAGVPVSYAQREIVSGAVIAPADIGTTEVAAESPFVGVGLAPDKVAGRTALGDLAAGEMITANRLTDGAARPGFATMPVAFADESLTQFLTAGSRIDIVWTPDDFSDRSSEVVVRDARVLQVRSGSATSRPGFASPVLLEVAEDDAVRLAAAMGSGSLSVLGR